MRYKLIGLAVLCSFAPLFYVIINAEHTLRKTRVKELAKNRRERLDAEHGIDRPEMKEDFDKLDEIYRVSEKVEIEKFRRIGKTSKEYFKNKELREEFDEQEVEEGLVAKPKMSAAEYFKQKYSQGPEGMSVKEVVGDGFSQVEVSHKADSKDPRVGGTKIIFDSRLDDATKATENIQIKSFIKAKADQKEAAKPKMTELEKQKQMLQALIEEQSTDAEPEEKKSGFQRKKQASGFRPADADADVDSGLYESTSDPSLIKTIERYNIVMDFVNRISKSQQEKQLCCYIIAKLVPDLDNLSFSEIDNMLEMVGHGITKTSTHSYEDDKNTELYDFLKLKLTKTNLEKMMETACSDSSAEFSNVTNNLKSRVTAISGYT